MSTPPDPNASPLNQLIQDLLDDDDATIAAQNGWPPGTTIPEIPITTDMTDMVNAMENAILAFPNGPHLFQRARMLCGIAHGAPTPKWLSRPPDAPTIVAVEPPYIAELAGRAAQWLKYESRAKTWKPTLPSLRVITTLCARLTWRFAPLEGIVCAPTLRADGAIIQKPGYDAGTGLFLDTNGVQFAPIPEHADLDEAVAALAILEEIFVDFPFAELHFQSAALAAVLTLAARHAVVGNIPLFAVRSNMRASGKGLLVNAISTVATGRPAPCWPQVMDAEEERKRLLTIALSGDSCCHIDNITHPFGSAPLDTVLTTREISDRLLGKNQHATVPFLAVLFASGNNMVFKSDTARRVLPVDFDSKLEKPEERIGFHHEKLLPWIQDNRPRFLVAALTVLKAFFNAGCPSQGVSALGGFEAWSDLIRQALVWAGKPDPCEGRKDIEAESDTGYEALAGLLDSWEECYQKGAVTLARAIQDSNTRAEENPSAVTPPNEWNALFEALSRFDERFDGKRLDSKRIGDGLRKIKGHVVGKRRLIPDKKKTSGAAKWRIETL